MGYLGYRFIGICEYRDICGKFFLGCLHIPFVPLLVVEDTTSGLVECCNLSHRICMRASMHHFPFEAPSQYLSLGLQSP